MRRILGLLLLVWAMAAQAQPIDTNYVRQVFLEWDNSPDLTVTGYRLYWGLTNGVGGSNTFDAKTGDTNALAYLVSRGYVIPTNCTVSTVSNLVVHQTYWFYVTAYDGTGSESDPSNVIYYKIPFRGPRRVRF